MFQDPSPLIRRLFLDKTHKLLKEHAIPSRYACAFAFAGPDCPKDLQEDVGLYPSYVFCIYYFGYILTDVSIGFCLLSWFAF